MVATSHKETVKNLSSVWDRKRPISVIGQASLQCYWLLEVEQIALARLCSQTDSFKGRRGARFIRVNQGPRRKTPYKSSRIVSMNAENQGNIRGDRVLAGDRVAGGAAIKAIHTSVAAPQALESSKASGV